MQSTEVTVSSEIFGYLSSDHDRLDRLLERAAADPDHVDLNSYDEFRKGLLRHISIEEKILLPAIARMRGGTPAPDAARLRLDHGAIAALLVPPPNASIIRTIRSILSVHNPLEEGDGGVYMALEMMEGEEAEALLRQMKTAPAVPAMPFNGRPEVIDATRRALARAGYELK
jgi:hypothetical protein